MLLIIDNYDSFTYNLVQYLGELGADMKIVRNDEVSVDEIEREIRPEKILISPGPGTPDAAGITLETIARFAGRLPILGVCLGHQAIGQHFGGKVVRAPNRSMENRSSVHHDGRSVFEGVPEISTPDATIRYRRVRSVPDCLEISATSPDGLIMAMRHRSRPVEGVQFHPESILTDHGKLMPQIFRFHKTAYTNRLGCTASGTGVRNASMTSAAFSAFTISACQNGQHRQHHGRRNRKTPLVVLVAQILAADGETVCILNVRLWANECRRTSARLGRKAGPRRRPFRRRRTGRARTETVGKAIVVADATGLPPPNGHAKNLELPRWFSTTAFSTAGPAAVSTSCASTRQIRSAAERCCQPGRCANHCEICAERTRS